MLPIFFLAFAFINQLSTTAVLGSLNYYDADRDLDVIKVWYDMVKNPLNEKKAMGLLRDEAKDEKGKENSLMDDFLQRAIKSKRCASVTDMTLAECLVVIMYTAEGLGKSFYKEYNAASIEKKWQPYKVYTTLLMSALQKLAKIHPIPKNAILYRGIDSKAERPNAKSIFLMAFTSTSLDLKTAQKFAGSEGMILEFHPPHSRYAAQLGKSSKFLEEKEILLPPFIAFDLLNVDRSGSDFKFKTSKVQKLNA
jgi:hypothetical protein